MAFDKEAYLQSVYAGGEFLPEPAPTAPVVAPQKSGLIRRAVGDTAVAALRGAEGVSEMGLGLANLATGGLVGKGTDYIGLTGKEGYMPRFKEITEEWYSPEAQAARQEVGKAEGFMGTLGAIAESPSILQTMGVEAVPAMFAGGAAAKGLQAVTKLAAPAAAAIGEGGVVAGGMAENIRSQDPNNIAGMYAAVPAGILTGAISRGATKLGLGDVETAIAGGAGTAGGVVARTAKGFAGEGGQELFQGAQEQIWQNLATGRPLSEGVAESMAQGLVLGGVMGAAVNVVAGRPKEAQPAPTDTNEDIASKVDAKLAALEAPAQGELFPNDGVGPAAPAAPAAEGAPTYSSMKDLDIARMNGEFDGAMYAPEAPGIVESMQQMAAGQESFDFNAPVQSLAEVTPDLLKGAKFSAVEGSLQQQLTELGNNLTRLGVEYPDVGIPSFNSAKGVYARRAKAAGQKLTEDSLRAGHIGNLITARNYLQQLEADARAEYDARAAERGAAMEQRVAQRQEDEKWAQVQALRPVGTTADMFPAEAVEAARGVRPEAITPAPIEFTPEEQAQRDAMEYARSSGQQNLITKTGRIAPGAAQPIQEVQNAVQERRTEEAIPRTGTEGGNISQGGEGVRQEIQGISAAPQGKALSKQEIAKAKIEAEAAAKAAEVSARRKARKEAATGGKEKAAQVKSETEAREAKLAAEKKAANAKAAANLPPVVSLWEELGAKVTPIEEAAPAKPKEAPQEPKAKARTPAEILAKWRSGQGDAAHGIGATGNVLPIKEVQQASSGAELLAATLKNSPPGPLSKLLEMMQAVRFLSDVKIRFIKAGDAGLPAGVVSQFNGGAQALSVTDDKGTTIYLRSDSPLTDTMVAHEVMHAVTSAAIERSPAMKAEFAALTRTISRALGTDTEAGKTWAKFVAGSPRELLTYALTSPGFREVLSTFAADGKPFTEYRSPAALDAVRKGPHPGRRAQVSPPAGLTLLQRVTDFVRKLLGVPTVHADRFAADMAAYSDALSKHTDAEALYNSLSPLLGKLEAQLQALLADTNEKGIALPSGEMATDAVSSLSRESGDTPVGDMMTKIGNAYANTVHSSAARKVALGWMSKHHIRETYGTAKTGWRGALRKLSSQLDIQDGRMSGLRQESGLVGALFTEFENTVKAAKGWGKNEFYSFMRETSEESIDPRLALSGAPDTLLAPLDEQRIMVDGKLITYKQALEQDKAKAAAVAKLKDAGKPYEQQERNSRALTQHLAATARNHAEITSKYKQLFTREQHAASLEAEGKDPKFAIDMKGAYLSKYRMAAKQWQTFGELRSTDGKSRRVAHEMYDTVERHLKSLGAQELYSTVNAWYDVFYVKGSGVPRATSPREMLKQMKAGDVGGSDGMEFAKKVDTSISRMHQGPYFHNARWGQFYVKYTDSAGELHREHFESQADWKAEVAELTKMAANKEITDFASGKQADEVRGEGSISSKQLQSMISKAHEQIGNDASLTDAEKDAKKSLMTNTLSRAYVELLPETSTRTMRLLRRNVKGASNDMKRAFNKRAEAAHIHIAMGENMPKILQLVRDLEGEVKALEGGVDKSGDPKEQVIARDITDEMKKRLKDLAEQPDTPVRDMLSSVNHTMYLAANPAYLLSNLLQPYQFVGMLGGTYGMVKSLRTLAGKANVAFDILKEAGSVSMWDPHLDFGKHLAEAEVVEAKTPGGKHKGLTLNQWKMLDELNKRGKLDVTLAREMNTMSQSSTPNEGINRAHEFVRRAGVGGHYTEAFNRITTALAAYDLATSSSKPMSHEEASSYAERMVDETQLNYSGVNKARMLGKKGIAGANTPLLMAFKSYTMQVLEMHIRTINRATGKGRAERRTALENSLEGRTPEEVKTALLEFDQREDTIASDGKKQLAGMLTMTSILAGTMGLPAATALAAVANALGGDDEDVRNKYRNAVSSAFGPDMGGMLTNGVLHGAGMDLQGNIGLQDIIPFTRFLADRREFKDKVQGLANDSSGAFVGMAENVVSGLAELMDGNVLAGLQKMMPKAISAPLKGGQLGVEGAYRDSKGNLLPMEASAWDVMLTGMNFKPSDISDRNTANRYYRSEKYLQGKDKAEFQKAYNKAREDKDAAARAEVIEEVRQYNAEHPGSPIKLQSLEQSYRTLQTQILVAKQSGTGILASRKQAPDLEKYGWGS